MPTTPHPVRQEVNLKRGAGRLFTGPPPLRLVRSVVVKIAQLPLYLMPLLLAAEGCFQYVPEGDVAPTRGSPIRVHLERPTSFELTQFTVNNVIRVDGEMVRREAGDVILSATWLDAVTGVGFAGEGRTLRIPETTVTALELKKISWWRTGAAVLGGALVTILGFDLLGTGTEGSGGGGGSVNPL